MESLYMLGGISFLKCDKSLRSILIDTLVLPQMKRDCNVTYFSRVESNFSQDGNFVKVFPQLSAV